MNLRARMLLSLCLSLGPLGAAVAEVSPADGTTVKPPPVLGGFITETRIVYPLQLDGWEAQGEHLYDAQELGASVRFVDKKHSDRWIDLYFYPAGTLDPEGFGKAMLHERDALLAAARPGASYRDMELGPTEQFDYRSPGPDGKKGEKAKGYSLDLQMVLQGQMLHSAMTLQLDRMYYVKGRMSTPEHDLSRSAVRRKLEKFVAGVAGKLEIASTGGCWKPMPVEPLLTAEKPAASLFTLKADGIESVVVTADKVLAAEPASPEARVAMMLGMSMTGRFVEGCEAPEELNRTVREGMRELRLEYRAQDPGSDGQSPSPLRARRTSRG